MSHRNARTTLHGRMLIVQRHQQGWKQAHIAAAMGISRKCVHTWISRFAAEGEPGLRDRSSRPHRCPTRMSARVERQVIAARRRHRRGQDWLGPELGISARTVGRILRRRGAPLLRDCDPMTGAVIKASKATACRYERDRPGELVHVDVKKLGRIPDGGGWRAHGRSEEVRGRGVGYDYVHSMVDDHSRLAYSEIHADEKGPTCAGFITRAAQYFQSQGISRIERVITDNHLSYRRSAHVAAAIDHCTPNTSSSSRIAPGRTEKWSAITAPCKANGPTAECSPPTQTAPTPLHPGSSSTTLNVATAHSTVYRRSAGCDQRDG